MYDMSFTISHLGILWSQTSKAEKTCRALLEIARSTLAIHYRNFVTVSCSLEFESDRGHFALAFAVPRLKKVSSLRSILNNGDRKYGRLDKIARNGRPIFPAGREDSAPGRTKSEIGVL